MADHPAVHLLLGPENGRKQEFIQQVREELTRRSGSPAEEHRFHTFDTPPAELLSLLRNGSLFSACRLVFFHGVEDLKKKDEIGLLTDYLAHPAADAVLILISDSISVDKRLEAAVGKQRTKIFWELFDNQKRSWLAGYLSRQGVSLEPEAEDLLLELVENDTRDLKQECDKLTAFFPRGSMVSAEQIERLIYHGKEENVFTLFEQMVALDFPHALEILQKLLASGGSDASAVAILAGLAWQFRRLAALAELRAANYAWEEAFPRCGLRGKRNQKTYREAAGRFTVGELRRITAALTDCDAEVRRSRSDMYTHLLQLFLYRVMRKKGTALARFD